MAGLRRLTVLVAAGACKPGASLLPWRKPPQTRLMKVRSSAVSGDVDALRAIVHAALLAPSPLDRYRPGPSRQATHGPVALWTGGDRGPHFNAVLVLGPAPAEQVFALAGAFFDDPTGYSIILDAEVAGAAVEDGLRARGWRLDEEEPALVLSSLPASLPPAPPELVIRPVVDAAGFADFQTVSETPPVFLPSLAAALDPAVGLFVGYVEGRPVATSRLTCLGPIAEITGVSTVPAARRRGYATALTWAALAAARERGCEVATLTASAMGYPVYLRMGFRPVGLFRTYLPPE
jgi:ribosomal protein S18 acetylase RimI-like enzyme